MDKTGIKRNSPHLTPHLKAPQGTRELGAGGAEGPVAVFVDLPQGGATLAGTPLSQNLVPAALRVGGLRTGNGCRKQVGGARGPRWVGGPPGGAPGGHPPGLVRTDWEADKQKMVSPREVRRLLRGPGRPRSEAWDSCRVGHAELLCEPQQSSTPAPASAGQLWGATEG